LSEDAVRMWAAELVVALGHMRQCGIVHRDIKLENILIDQEGHLRITDFGFAHILRSPDEVLRDPCGTLHYAAPELLSTPRRYTRMVDWWALGVVLFELLTLHPPFDAPDKRALVRLICSVNLVFPHGTKPLSPAAQSLLRGLLCKDSGNRLGADEAVVRNHPFFAGIDWDSVASRWQPGPDLPALDEQSTIQRKKQALGISTVFAARKHFQLHSVWSSSSLQSPLPQLSGLSVPSSTDSPVGTPNPTRSTVTPRIAGYSFREPEEEQMGEVFGVPEDSVVEEHVHEDVVPEPQPKHRRTR